MARPISTLSRWLHAVVKNHVELVGQLLRDCVADLDKLIAPEQQVARSAVTCSPPPLRIEPLVRHARIIATALPLRCIPTSEEAPSMLGRASAGQVEEREERFVEIRRPARRLEPVVVYAPVNPVVF